MIKDVLIKTNNLTDETINIIRNFQYNDFMHIQLLCQGLKLNIDYDKFIRKLYEEMTNEEEYFKAFEILHKQGYKLATASIGYCYYHGKYVKVNPQLAEKYLKQVAESGNTFVAYFLGCAYYNGELFKKDYKLACYYLMIAASENSDAALMIGTIYDKGLIGRIDKPQAIYWYAKASEMNNLNATVLLASTYYSDVHYRDFAKAKKYFEKASDLGSADAVYMLGVIYFSGMGSAQDTKMAIEYFKKAKKMGNAQAEIMLNSMGYHEYTEMPQNDEPSKKPINEHLEDNNVQLGYNYLYGINQEINYEMAYNHFKLAKNDNVKEAYFYLGIMYKNGFYLPKNIDKALQNFLYSIELDNKYQKAHLHLGYMYYFGDGVLQNLEKANKHFENTDYNYFIIQETKQKLKLNKKNESVKDIFNNWLDVAYYKQKIDSLIDKWNISNESKIQIYEGYEKYIQNILFERADGRSRDYTTAITPLIKSFENQLNDIFVIKFKEYLIENEQDYLLRNYKFNTFTLGNFNEFVGLSKSKKEIDKVYLEFLKDQIFNHNAFYQEYFEKEIVEFIYYLNDVIVKVNNIRIDAVHKKIMTRVNAEELFDTLVFGDSVISKLAEKLK